METSIARPLGNVRKGSRRKSSISKRRWAIKTARIQETRKIISVTLKLARDCHTSYRKASPQTKKLWNQAFFAEIVIENKKVARVTYQEPFEALLRSRGSNKELLVELRRFELLTSTMPWWRSTN